MYRSLREGSKVAKIAAPQPDLPSLNRNHPADTVPPTNFVALVTQSPEPLICRDKLRCGGIPLQHLPRDGVVVVAGSAAPNVATEAGRGVNGKM